MPRALRWKLEGGGVVRSDELGMAALERAGLRVCVYDPASLTGPVVELGVAGRGDCDGRPCWRPQGPAAKGGVLRYRDKTGAASGVTDVRIQTRGGELVALVKARGPAMPATSAFPLALPLVAQVVVGEPERPLCWQTVLETVLRNDPSGAKLAQP